MSKYLYFFSNGNFKVKDGTLLFEKEYSETYFFPIKQIEDIYVNINNKFTPNIIKLLLKEGVFIHYFNDYEYYLGTLVPKNYKFSGKTIIKEVEHYNDLDKRLIIAREIIVGSLKNLYRNIRYYYNRLENIEILDINKYINKLENIKSINDLMLVEASFRKEYYQVFNNILKINNFKRDFDSEDIINSLLNFVNSLLYSLVFSEIMKTKISGQIGFVHEVDSNRYPLVYDIADIFKPLIVDRLIFRMINRKQLSNEDIIEGKISEEKIRIIFEEWNKQINKTIYHKELKRYMPYRQLIREEIYKIEKHLNEEKIYKSFKLWW